MANYFANLPAYKDPGGLEFSPLNQAVQNFGETSRQNVMAEYAAQRNKVADGRAAAQENRAASKFTAEQSKEALNQMAGLYQAIEAAPEAERPMMLQRAKPMIDRLRSSDPDWDSDARDAGLDPNDYAGISKLVIGRARGPVDPLEAQMKQAQISETQAKAKYYSERPAGGAAGAGGATGALADRLMAENPGLTLDQAITIARRGNAEYAAAGAKRGAATGEAQASLASLRSKMPGLEAVVRQLDELSEKATYTLAGQALDTMRRQAGAEPREAAVARKQYISMVDNQILPMLRDTFGAQFTQKEGESLKATMGDPDASPKEKQAVLKAFIEQKRRNIEAASAEAGGDAPDGADGWTDVGGVKIRVKP
jgi:hypothetical protein